MNASIIAPDYQWKQAASREGVDYDAVQKSFMDQAYGVVANKAKILFQDPFRLGFEIVHRNEKATKMVGIFAFRVNRELLYAPVFFVNGEIKTADMLYRTDVKRFVPLTEDWCSYLVRGVGEQAGGPVDKNRMRQADAYMDRLAYPQRVKYASFDDPELRELQDRIVKEAEDGTTFRDLMSHCSDASPMRKLIPEVINEGGPDALMKLASLVESGPTAAKFLSENYTKEELERVEAWLAKSAGAVDPEANSIVIITDPSMAKSASSRDRVFDRGYDLIDKRPEGSTNAVIEEIGDGTVTALASPCVADILTDGGKMERGVLLFVDDEMMGDPNVPVAVGGEAEGNAKNKPEYAYIPGSKELIKIGYGQDVFGDPVVWDTAKLGAVSAPSLSRGKCYIMIDYDRMACSYVFCLEDISKDGDSTKLTVKCRWGDPYTIYYAAGRTRSDGRYISDEAHFVEVDCELERRDGNICRIEPKVTTALMSSAGIDKWIRTAGGLTTSSEVTVSPTSRGTFDITHKVDNEVVKVARDLGMLDAHLALAEDFCLTTDVAGEILDKAVDRSVGYRVFDTITKQGYITRQEGMRDWVESFDPSLQVRLDAPQRQILSTYTPERQPQVSRYGDTYQRELNGRNPDSMQELLPADAIFNSSPEELAALSQKYDMPHIFDHGCMSQMATTSFNMIDQIKQYIPDLETGVDRLFRILFLLRYRPADFEEAYGKDALMEMEQELSELSGKMGESLLRLLRRFDIDQYTPQED